MKAPVVVSLKGGASGAEALIYMKSSEGDLRRIVSAAVLKGVPVPAMSSALAYFDMSRTARTTANLIQGQRDFFGAHGFERTDSNAKGLHGPWAMPIAG